MSGNPPSIVLLPSSTSSASSIVNPSLQTHAGRPSIVVHQPTVQSSPIPFKSVIVKPYRDSIQQVLTTTDVDMKPIILPSVTMIDSVRISSSIVEWHRRSTSTE